jgi:hypothetical protein
LPADWLDHLVLDMVELEVLAARLERSIGAIRPTEVSGDPLSVQILDVLTRVSDTTGALHQLAKGRLMSVATAWPSLPATTNQRPRWTGLPIAPPFLKAIQCCVGVSRYRFADRHGDWACQRRWCQAIHPIVQRPKRQSGDQTMHDRERMSP